MAGARRQPRAQRESAMRKKAMGSIFDFSSDEGEAAASAAITPTAATTPKQTAGAGGQAPPAKRRVRRSLRQGALSSLFVVEEDVSDDEDEPLPSGSDTAPRAPTSTAATDNASFSPTDSTVGSAEASSNSAGKASVSTVASTSSFSPPSQDPVAAVAAPRHVGGTVFTHLPDHRIESQGSLLASQRPSFSMSDDDVENDDDAENPSVGDASGSARPSTGGGARKRKRGPGRGSAGSVFSLSSQRTGSRVFELDENDAYEDPFDDDRRALKKRKAQDDGFEAILAGIGDGVDLAHRQDCMLQLLDRVAAAPDVAKALRHDIDDVFSAAARLNPADGGVSALWRVSLLCCTAIATHRANARVLGPTAWGALLAMLQTSLTGEHTPPPLEGGGGGGGATTTNGGGGGDATSAFTARAGSARARARTSRGANPAHAHFGARAAGAGRGDTSAAAVAQEFLRTNRCQLAALSKTVASRCDAGPNAPQHPGEETGVSLLLSSLTSLVVNTDYDVLVTETTSTAEAKQAAGLARRSFAKSAQRNAQRMHIPRYWSRLPAASRVVTYLASRLEVIYQLLTDAAERGFPDAYDQVSPKVLLRALYLLQLLSLYAAAVPEVRKPLLRVVVNVFTAAAAFAHDGEDRVKGSDDDDDDGDKNARRVSEEIATRCLWVLVHLTPPQDALSDAETSCIQDAVFLHTLEQLVLHDFDVHRERSNDDLYDRLCLSLNLLANVAQRDGDAAGVRALDVDRLTACYFAMKACDTVEAFVLASYFALLLSLISLGSETRRIATSKAISACDVAASKGKEKDFPLMHLAASLQQFVLFQSRHAILTPEVCARIADVNTRVMAMNNLKVE